MGFAAVQTLVGATKLSELGIDVSKNWLGYLIRNLGDPTLAQDAATKAYADSLIPTAGLLSALVIDTDKDWLGHLIKNLWDPIDAQDAATRAYVLAQKALCLLLTGGTMSGNIAMGTKLITGLGAPVAANDAARKAYVDAKTGSLFVWKDSSINIINIGNATSTISWTTRDITPWTSANATIALLCLRPHIDSITDPAHATLYVRKTGTTPTFVQGYTAGTEHGDTAQAAWRGGRLALVGLNTSQQFDYLLSISGTIQIDFEVNLLAYIE